MLSAREGFPEKILISIQRYVIDQRYKNQELLKSQELVEFEKNKGKKEINKFYNITLRVSHF